MRDTSSEIMEDAMSEDTMMDCGVDTEGMDPLEDLATDIPNSTSTIRDAAERLLSLLRVDELDDDFLSSSEDEGVEVDLDENEEDDDEDDLPNTRLLHQLAVTLAEELKYAQLQSNNISTKNNSQPCNRVAVAGANVDTTNVQQIQRMDVTCSDDSHQIVCGQSSMLGNKLDKNYNENYQHEDNSEQKQNISYRILDNQTIQSRDEFFVTNKRCRIDELHRIIDAQQDKTGENCESPSLWAAGWDSCAAEAVRYLIDVEGLDPTHPTVLSLKSHLEVQRNRAFVQYTT